MKYYDNKHHTMKRETIQQAALEHAVNTTGLDYIGEVECENGFIAGALWRIESVWHDTCEIPEPGKDCLVEYKDGDGNVCARLDSRSEYEWVNACHYDKIIRWAYVSDLLPDGKEDKP